MPIDPVPADTPLSKLPNFDPRAVPVVGVDVHLPAVPVEVLQPRSLRERSTSIDLHSGSSAITSRARTLSRRATHGSTTRALRAHRARHEKKSRAARAASWSLRRSTSGAVERARGPALLGLVDRLNREEGYGFALTDDGTSVYFHRNAVGGGLDWESLETGQRIALSIEAGTAGPQATVVTAPDPDAPSP